MATAKLTPRGARDVERRLSQLEAENAQLRSRDYSLQLA